MQTMVVIAVVGIILAVSAFLVVPMSASANKRGRRIIFLSITVPLIIALIVGAPPEVKEPLIVAGVWLIQLLWYLLQVAFVLGCLCYVAYLIGAAFGAGFRSK